MTKIKIIRITTVPQSLKTLLKGQLRYMSSHFEVIGVSSPGNELGEVKEQENIEVVAIPMTRTISPIADLRALWKLYKFIKKEKPLIVHTHTPKAGTLGMLASYLAKVPLRMHTVAGLPLLESKGLKRSLLNTVEKMTYGCATHVYPNSFELQKIILKNNFTSYKKLKVIANGSSNGIDTSFFDPKLILEEDREKLKQELGILPKDFVFIFLGRLVKDKGINELVEAFYQLTKKHSNLKLLLVGGFENELDPLSKQTTQLIKDNSSIQSVGFQKEVRPYLSISNVLAFPSYREGFPNVVMQAGAMELPAIVTDINGCNEIINEGENGLIIPVKDIHSLLEAMTQLFENEQLFIKLKGNARINIENRFEQKVVWNALLEEYQNQIKK